jgi:hypothetical protein
LKDGSQQGTEIMVISLSMLILFGGSIAIDHLQELNCDYNLLSDKMRAERGRLILFPGDLAEYGTRFSFAPCS